MLQISQRTVSSMTSFLGSVDASTDSNYWVGGCIHRPKNESRWMHTPTEKLESVEASADPKTRVGGGLRWLNIKSRWRSLPTLEMSSSCRLSTDWSHTPSIHTTKRTSSRLPNPCPSHPHTWIGGITLWLTCCPPTWDIEFLESWKFPAN